MIYRLTNRAKADIQDIDRYSAREHGLVQSDIYLGGLDYMFELLCDNPKMGRHIQSNRHIMTYRFHHILYRVEAQKIVILRIWSARMPLPKAWQT